MWTCTQQTTQAVKTDAHINQGKEPLLELQLLRMQNELTAPPNMQNEQATHTHTYLLHAQAQGRA
jgi:hypothetical protein